MNFNANQLMSYYLQTKLNTPLGKNIYTLAQNNETEKLLRIARNVCEQKGIDFDSEFRAFQQSFK